MAPKIIQKLFVFTLYLALIPNVARAQEISFSTGNGFLEYCEFERAECNNYIAGMVDGLYATQAYANINILQNSVCMPDNTTIRQNKDIFVKYLQQNPKVRSQHTGLLFIEALKQAFPC